MAVATDHATRWKGLLLIVVAATLESVFALCIGCRIFALLMRAGVIPASVRESCNDIREARPGRNLTPV